MRKKLMWNDIRVNVINVELNRRRISNGGCSFFLGRIRWKIRKLHSKYYSECTQKCAPALVRPSALFWCILALLVPNGTVATCGLSGICVRICVSVTSVKKYDM